MGARACCCAAGFLARSVSFDGRTLDEVERRHILRILEETGGNHLRAAEILGIRRRTLYRKLENYKISTGDFD
ncbi:MAG: hypothetical protein J2P21_27375 [Chloracidobacterium sp.]|nr:hypothetical protein [Chloracidobacterium sp.]